MRAGKPRTMAVRLRIDDEVDIILTVERDILRPVPSNGAKSHRPEKVTEDGRIRCRVFDELEPVGTHWVFEQISHSDDPLTMREQSI
jgi:hypothetical protein